MNISMLAYSFYEFHTRVQRYEEILAMRGGADDSILLNSLSQKYISTLISVNVYRIQNWIINEKKSILNLTKIILLLVMSLFFITLKHIRKLYDIIPVHSVPDFVVFVTIIPKIIGMVKNYNTSIIIRNKRILYE